MKRDEGGREVSRPAAPVEARPEEWRSPLRSPPLVDVIAGMEIGGGFFRSAAFCWIYPSWGT